MSSISELRTVVMDRRHLGQNIAEGLHSTEVAINDAAMNLTELATNMLAAHKLGKLAPGLGQNAFSRVSSAIAAMAEVRQMVIDAHGYLGSDQSEIGIKVTAIGDAEDCPPKPQRG
jgi:hypothetical protein